MRDRIRSGEIARTTELSVVGSDEWKAAIAPRISEVLDRWTVLGTLGYGFPGVINVGASSSSAYELGIGLRRNFGSRPFRPFAHLEANRVWYDAGCAHISSSAYVGGGGVEYFVAPRVSIEGLAGVEHFANNQRCDANSYHYRSTSTFRSAVSVSFYF